MKLLMRQLYATIKMSFLQIFDGNMFQVTLNYFIQFVELLFLTIIWRSSIIGTKTFQSIASYIVVSYILMPLFNIITPATSALWEGSIINRYTRPLPIMASFVGEMIGKSWIPYFCFFSIPVIILSNIFNFSLAPISALNFLWFLSSLVLSIVIGISFDIIFAALAIYLKESRWAVFQIRMALFSLFSGALIPFHIMPDSLAKILSILPFSTIASAPLNIYFGLENPAYMLGKQVFWGLILIFCATVVHKHSQERMVSFGG